MLFGNSTNELTAHSLLDYAYDHGIYFYDSAEMYPVPQCPNTTGSSETILGRWLAQKPRSNFIISTKIAGPGAMDWIRGGPTSLDAMNITEAIKNSLTRLNTDYIDLVSLHWPDRYVPMFGDTEYDCSRVYKSVPFEEQYEALSRAVEQGLVRHIGLSNETPYGLMKFNQLATTNNSNNNNNNSNNNTIVSVQNAYSMLCRTFDTGGLAECCAAEDISLLAYSPLAMGLLTGKYLPPDGGPPDARLNKYKGRYAEAESRYGPKPNVQEAVQAYVDVARRYGMSPVHMAVRFVLDHPLVASAVVGATSVGQLEELVGAAAVVEEVGPLSREIREDIDAIHNKYPNPTP